MHLFVLTGAGISAESGLRTFRDPGGLWEERDPRALATPEAFRRDPALVHRFYDWRRRGAREAQPNAAHRAIARLGWAMAQRGDRLTLVTQNVDGLHERAGSDAVAMHGRLDRARCTRCGARHDWAQDLSTATPCPACGAAGGMRPDIVWFGEEPMQTGRIFEALGEADAFAAIGTSGAVYPAAGFVAAAGELGLPTCEFNLQPADNARAFGKAVYGRAGETVPRFAEAVERGGFAAAFAALA